MSKDSDKEFQIAFYEDLLRRGPDDTTVLELLAGLYTETGRIDEGLTLDLRNVRLDPHNPGAHYNLACSLALKNRKDEAFASLKTALEKGFSNVGWMIKDPDLRSLRGDPRFTSLVKQFKAGV